MRIPCCIALASLGLSAQSSFESQMTAETRNAHLWRGIPLARHSIANLGLDLDTPWSFVLPGLSAGVMRPKLFLQGTFDTTTKVLRHREYGLEAVLLDRRRGKQPGGFHVEGGLTWSESREGFTPRAYREAHLGLVFDDLRLPSATLLWDSREGGFYLPITSAFPLNVGLPFLLEATVAFVSHSPKLGRLRSGTTYTGLHDGTLTLKYQRYLGYQKGDVWLELQAATSAPLGKRGREAVGSLAPGTGRIHTLGGALTWRFRKLY